MNQAGRTRMAARARPLGSWGQTGAGRGVRLPPMGRSQLCPLVLALGVHCSLVSAPRARCPNRSLDSWLRATLQGSCHPVSWDVCT